jgi:hypothetical protein
MEYFKHDINASEDDKICELLANGGYEILGYYWRFIEYLYSRNGKVCKNKLNSIAWSLHMDTNKLKELIANYGLFYEDEEYIFSKRVLAEVKEFEAVGKRMAEIGRLGGKASAKAKSQANAEPHAKAEGKASAKADAQQNKKKKIKENKINNTPDGDNALSGDLPNGYSVHKNSGEIYTVVDGVMYNIYGEELNQQGFKKIDFNLSKHNL